MLHQVMVEGTSINPLREADRKTIGRQNGEDQS